MKRQRLDVPGLPMHITHRGVDRAPVFRQDIDRQAYLIALAGASERFAVRLHAYVLMGNHVHLLASADSEGAIGRMMQLAVGRYTRQANSRWERSGTLWEGRFRSCIVDSDAYLLNCIAYIELNPVRAGMCRRAWDWPWSSVHHHLGTRRDPWMHEHAEFVDLGTDRRRRWREILEQNQPPELLDAIRGAMQSQVGLGTPGFLKQLAGASERPLPRRRPGRPPTGA